jgi:hypothetical protein
MLNRFFNWLRSGAESAILEGVGDAVEKLTSEEKPLPPRLAALVAKIEPRPALPAAEVETPEPPIKPARKPKHAAG